MYRCTLIAACCAQGALVSWGAGEWGQLGVGSESTSQQQPRPAKGAKELRLARYVLVQSKTAVCSVHLCHFVGLTGPCVVWVQAGGCLILGVLACGLYLFASTYGICSHQTLLPCCTCVAPSVHHTFTHPCCTCVALSHIYSVIAWPSQGVCRFLPLSCPLQQRPGLHLGSGHFWCPGAGN